MLTLLAESFSRTFRIDQFEDEFLWCQLLTSFLHVGSLEECSHFSFYIFSVISRM